MTEPNPSHEVIAAAERRRFYNESEIRCSPILVFADAEILANEYLRLTSEPPSGLAEAVRNQLSLSPFASTQAKEEATNRLASALAAHDASLSRPAITPEELERKVLAHLKTFHSVTISTVEREAIADFVRRLAEGGE